MPWCSKEGRTKGPSWESVCHVVVVDDDDVAAHSSAAWLFQARCFAQPEAFDDDEASVADTRSVSQSMPTVTFNNSLLQDILPALYSVQTTLVRGTYQTQQAHKHAHMAP